MAGNLRIKHLVVESLVQYARNARTHSEAQMTERNGAGPSWAEKHHGSATRVSTLVTGADLMQRCVAHVVKPALRLACRRKSMQRCATRNTSDEL